MAMLFTFNMNGPTLEVITIQKTVHSTAPTVEPTCSV